MKYLSCALIGLFFLQPCFASEAIIANENKAEQQQESEISPSYWRQYAPQMLQDAGDYAASFVPQSVKDRINSWSTRKKLAIAGAIIASLAVVYNKEFLLATLFDKKLPAPDDFQIYRIKNMYKQIKPYFNVSYFKWREHNSHPNALSQIEKETDKLLQLYREKPDDFIQTAEKMTNDSYFYLEKINNVHHQRNIDEEISYAAIELALRKLMIEYQSNTGNLL